MILSNKHPLCRPLVGRMLDACLWPALNLPWYMYSFICVRIQPLLSCIVCVVNHIFFTFRASFFLYAYFIFKLDLKLAVACMINMLMLAIYSYISIQLIDYAWCAHNSLHAKIMLSLFWCSNGWGVISLYLPLVLALL